ncbi:MAG: hypothetical protein PHV23_04775 [Candidatus Gracilibacteria bacterium]|nr:hypothetical protein [Candidatus Gracilibacteria bacterium]
MGDLVISYKGGGIDTVRKDIKRLKLDEKAFMLSLNSVVGKEYKDLDDIPSDLIPDLVVATRSMVLHVIGLNTIVEKIGIKNITPDFEFSTSNSSEFVRILASNGEITSSILKKYIMNRRQYIESLLIHS